MATIELDGKVRRTSESYSNRPSPYPHDETLTKGYAVDRFLAAGWMPSQGFLTKIMPIVAFGSCFASNISKYLSTRGYNVLTSKAGAAPVTRMGDGMVHTHAIRQQFEWAWEGRAPKGALWRDYDEQEFGYSEETRLETKRLFDAADLFIITLGLSEIWFDEPTGEVFWRAPPKGKFDATRHKFRVASFAETTDNLKAIHSLIRKYRPEAHIVVTVSPIPLAASFRPVSAISANAASKAIIRAAVDEYFRGEGYVDDKLHYFPSYDMVMYGFDNQWTEDRRHVCPHVLEFNMKVFEHYYCLPALSKEWLQHSYRKARIKDRRAGILGTLPPSKGGLVPSDLKAVKRIQKWAEQELAKIRRREAAKKNQNSIFDERLRQLLSGNAHTAE